MAAYLSLWSGARCGEICALAADDFRPTIDGRLELHIGHTISETSAGLLRTAPKSAAGMRTVAISHEAGRTLAAYLDDQPGNMRVRRDAPLIPGENGSWMRPSMVSRCFSAMRDGLGLPREATFHTLRHTHAAWLIANGVDVRTVAARMGHAKVTMTLETYAHVMPGSDRAAADAFESAAMRAVGDGRR